MRGVRIVGRGLSDTLEHLLPFSLSSLAWWLGVLLVVPAPAATLALFTMTDPRSSVERPEIREGILVARHSFGRGWALLLFTVPVPVILFSNLAFYGRDASFFAWLAPLWLILLLLSIAITLCTFSIAALLDLRPLVALRTAAFLTLAYPLRAAVVLILLWLVFVVGGALVVPLVMFLPATAAATINRLVLAGLDVPIPDPLAPTEERLREERVQRGSKRFGP